MNCTPIIDEEFRRLIPALASDELQLLEANLLRDGCREPLAVWRDPVTGHDVLLDGHNRKDICDRFNKSYETWEIEDLPNREAAMAWIIRNQFGRRNLQPYQRAELALTLEPLIAVRAKENQRKVGGPVPSTLTEAPIDTREELAKISGLSAGTIHKAKVISSNATEEVKKALRSGATTINKVHSSLRPQKEKPLAKHLPETIEIAATEVQESSVKDSALIANGKLVAKFWYSALSATTSMISIRELVCRVIDTEAWRKREFDGHTYEHDSFMDFITTKPPAGCGWTLDIVEKFIVHDRETLDKFNEALKRPVPATSEPAGKPLEGSTPVVAYYGLLRAARELIYVTGRMGAPTTTPSNTITSEKELKGAVEYAESLVAFAKTALKARRSQSRRRTSKAAGTVQLIKK